MNKTKSLKMGIVVGALLVVAFFTAQQQALAKTYCDVPNPSNPCHDRKDNSDTTGLYQCMDGSDVADWRDCNGDDNDNGNNDNDNSKDEDEETSNCGGESCTPTEKEDSWVE
jgi:hypothetical protein